MASFFRHGVVCSARFIISTELLSYSHSSKRKFIFSAICLLLAVYHRFCCYAVVVVCFVPEIALQTTGRIYVDIFKRTDVEAPCESYWGSNQYFISD